MSQMGNSGIGRNKETHNEENYHRHTYTREEQASNQSL